MGELWGVSTSPLAHPSGALLIRCSYACHPSMVPLAGRIHVRISQPVRPHGQCFAGLREGMGCSPRAVRHPWLAQACLTFFCLLGSCRSSVCTGFACSTRRATGRMLNLIWYVCVGV